MNDEVTVGSYEITAGSRSVYVRNWDDDSSGATELSPHMAYLMGRYLIEAAFKVLERRSGG